MFYTVNHKILLQKLEATVFFGPLYGIVVSVISCERIFFIETENQLSDYGKISCGAPQGSVLGTLIFLIYVNGMT